MFARIVIVAAALLAACSPPAPVRPAEAPETAAPAVVEDASVAVPLANARVTSPFLVSGTAPADWFFENQFPVRLVDGLGGPLAEAPAHPRVNWTEPGAKQFDAELNFSVSAETPATLVLQEDMPQEGVAPRELRIPVVLVPAP